MEIRPLLAILALACGPTVLGQRPPLDVLPATATARLASSLAAARPHPSHLWRDTPPTNADGTMNAYIEIARGDRRKWEFDINTNTRRWIG